VEQRTVQLAAQIQQREQVEHEHVLAQERARVARDLHDQLGSGLTEISMLSARAGAASAAAEKRHEHLQQVELKAQEMVAALDEIVWAMNPKHDSTASLASYFCQYADRFLGLAMVACRTNVTPVRGDYGINSLRRHQLFLAFKEALTNVVRHSRATEVRLQFQADQDELQIVMTDNGRGLPRDSGKADMDGVSNMRERLQELGGTFEITNEAEGGAMLRFCLPLD
jgi:signal transduction histidine kinase